MGMPAARVGDMHVCPMVTGIVPHVGGPILPAGGIPVLIGGLPAARVGDQATCIGPPDVIVLGSFKVLIRGQPAARMGDTTAPRRDHRNGLSDRSDRLSRTGSHPAQGVRCPRIGLARRGRQGAGSPPAQPRSEAPSLAAPAPWPAGRRKPCPTSCRTIGSASSVIWSKATCVIRDSCPSTWRSVLWPSVSNSS
jgi:uncharacterized Zn-binding protein involved in type VI secretion